MPSFDATRLDVSTVRELARMLEKRIGAVEAFADGGCPVCHEAQARRFVVQLRRLADEAAEAGSPGKAA